LRARPHRWWQLRDHALTVATRSAGRKSKP
jgi:hypothetical protein